MQATTTTHAAAALSAALLIVVALGALAGWLGFRATNSRISVPRA